MVIESNRPEIVFPYHWPNKNKIKSNQVKNKCFPILIKEANIVTFSKKLYPRQLTKIHFFVCRNFCTAAGKMFLILVNKPRNFYYCLKLSELFSLLIKAAENIYCSKNNYCRQLGCGLIQVKPRGNFRNIKTNNLPRA